MIGRIYPVEGRRVRHRSGRLIEAGDRVVVSSYWRRLAGDGDIELREDDDTPRAESAAAEREEI